LPEPFVHDKANTFMDFYNPLYWTGDEGVYSVWKSVYPPLNFIILSLYKIFFVVDNPDYRDSNELRSIIDWQIPYIVLVYIFLIILTIKKSFTAILDRKQIIIISLAVILSPPCLFALERGNLIFFSIYIFSLYIWGNNNLIRIISYSILVNIKPYFLIIYFLQLIRVKNITSNKDFLILSPLISIAIFLITGIVLNVEYYLIFENLLGFAAGTVISIQEIFAFPTSIIAFSSINGLFQSFQVPNIILFIPKAIVLYYLILIIFQFYNKNLKDDYFYIFIILFLTNYSTSAGGYSCLYYLPIFPLLYLNKEYVILLILAFSFFVGIWDVIPLFSLGSWSFDAYLSGKLLPVNVDFSLGSIVRPFANFFSLVIFYKHLKGHSVA
jgi:hypothetical protein